MKKLPAIAAAVALAVVFLIAPGGVSATIQARPLGGGPHDFAVGGFERANGAHTGFSAHSGALGEDPFGHLSATIPGVRQDRYDVTCLAVAGNHASIGLVPSDAGSNDATLETVLVVVDSGLPGGTGDRYGFVLNPGVQAANCAAFVLATPPFMPVTGNIVVRDATP
jgi:hypothetical protein